MAAGADDPVDLPGAGAGAAAEQADLVPDAQDAQDRLAEPVLGDLSAAHGVQDAVVGDVDVRREQQLVDAGLRGEAGHPVVALLGAHTGHVEGVGDDDALEAGVRRAVRLGESRTTMPDATHHPPRRLGSASPFR
ncbi:hypothetical protein GCM10010348_48400 [Streptomyces anthocyanicus]|nr:hypothetical protein GCM10010348_48400 [Streptomyces anthocyanicus]